MKYLLHDDRDIIFKTILDEIAVHAIAIVDYFLNNS